jgi:hypothetical protein
MRECREETFTQLESENRMESYQFENLCFGGWEYYNSSYRITMWGCGLNWDLLRLSFKKFLFNLGAFLYMELGLRSAWLRYELDGPRFESQKGRGIFLSSKASRLTPVADEACCLMGVQFFPGSKAAVAWGWLLSST